MWMWMSVGNRERRHFRSNGVSSCRRVRDIFSDDELLLLDDRWQQQRHKLLGCDTCGLSHIRIFSLFSSSSETRSNGTIYKKIYRRVCVLGPVVPASSMWWDRPFSRRRFFFPWERESSRAAAAGWCSSRSPFTAAVCCLTPLTSLCMGKAISDLYDLMDINFDCITSTAKTHKVVTTVLCQHPFVRTNQIRTS